MRRVCMVGLCVGSMAVACDVEKDDGNDVVSNQASASQGDTDDDGDTDGDTDDDTDGDTDDDASSSTGNEAPPVCDAAGVSRTCASDEVPEGMQYCDGEQWGPCLTPACNPGDISECPGSGELAHCELVEGAPTWTCEDPMGCVCAGNGGGEEGTPLVFSFDRSEPEYATGTAAFDLDVKGACLGTDWPTATTPWLALDRDGDGLIGDGRELFGSGTRLASGARASQGFMALAELDDDHDGRITPADAAFDRLVLWSDVDGDRRGVAGEQLPLSAFGVLDIELGYQVEQRCDDRGNCGVERASFTFVGRGGAIEHGAVIDVHLACQ